MMPPSAELEATRTLLSDPGYTDLDAVDRQLIELLQADGRIPYAELGRRAGITEKTARRRVSRLLDEGYITIAAITDPAVLGFGSLGLALLTVDGSRTPVASRASRSAISGSNLEKRSRSFARAGAVSVTV